MFKSALSCFDEGVLPCVIFEDDDLLVVNKPAGWNTHAPGPFAGEGIYDWLRHREPRWARLAIVHRLDKETSGVIVFGKTASANRSLTEQFTQRVVGKKYILLTDQMPKRRELTAKTRIIRAGDRYVSSPRGEPAETRFRMGAGLSKLKVSVVASCQVIEAEPLTGRTHQVRVHAAENGFPVLGDSLYGGSRFHRVCLHAAELDLKHPTTGKPMTFRAPVDFNADTRMALRDAVIDRQETDTTRLIHGASDGWPGWSLDRLGEFLYSQSERELSSAQLRYLESVPDAKGAYHKQQRLRTGRATASPDESQLAFGVAAPERFAVRENGVQFELSFNEGQSVGLFLDQRDNRRRLLHRYVASDFPLLHSEMRSSLLNCFAYTCAFSVCAAKAGMQTTSLDLSKNYLEWGRRNFVLNGLKPDDHDFIYGDVFGWLRRLAGKKRVFDVILLDPPTFSHSKERGTFRVEKDYGKLIRAALPLLKAKGVLFASTNSASWLPEKFLSTVETTIATAGRTILQRHYVPQPPDFPVSRAEPAYLKTVWLQL